MKPEEREKLNLQAFLTPDVTSVGEITLRPLSLGSFCILKEVGNELLTGRGEGGAIQNELLAITEYFYIHAAPLEEVQRVAFRAGELRVAAVAFAMGHPPSALLSIQGEIARGFEEMKAAGFEVEEKPGGDAEEKDAPPNS